MSNRLYRFNNNKTWHDVFDDVADPEEISMKKADEVMVRVSERGTRACGVQSFEPDTSEPIAVVQEFDNRLKFATFTVNRYYSDMHDEEKEESGSAPGRTYFDVIMSIDA